MSNLHEYRKMFGSGWPNSYVRDLNYPQGERDVAFPSGDGRTAKLPDGTLLRLTPTGQPTVADLVHFGMVVRSNHGVGGKVVSVHPYEQYGVPAYTVTVVDDRHKTGWYNEFTTQDGRILHLFVDNRDELFFAKETTLIDQGDYQLEAFVK